MTTPQIVIVGGVLIRAGLLWLGYTQTEVDSQLNQILGAATILVTLVYSIYSKLSSR
jgi:hypothetical protein